MARHLTKFLKESKNPSGAIRPSMGLMGSLFITLSCLSPSIAVFVVGSQVIHQVGTGVFACFSAAACFGVAMACVYGELGSAFPSSGGEYTIVGAILGPQCARGILGLNLLGFCISLALSGFSVAAYLEAVWPALPARPLAALAVAVVTGLAILRIEVGAFVTGGFILIELVALVILTVLGARHIHAPLSALIHPMQAGATGALEAPALGAMAAATAAGIYAFNGYGAAIFFGEDMRDSHDVAPTVLLALAAGIVIVMPPIAFVILGAPDLLSLSRASAPIPAFIEEQGGHGLAQVMSFGVALAVFNTMIAIALMAGRQLYATGRDGLWPPSISKALASTHGRWGSPWIATSVMGGFGLLGCLLDPKALVLILGNGNIVTYSALCLCALRVRRPTWQTNAAWRMPFYPAAPVLGLLFLWSIAAISLADADARRGMLVTAVTLGAATLVFAQVERWRSTD